MALTDLVKICLDSYNLMIQGQFPASISKEVSDHLETCTHVINTLTIKEEENE